MLIYILPDKRSIFFESKFLISSDKFVVTISNDFVAVLCLGIVYDGVHDSFADTLSFISFPGDDILDMSCVFSSSPESCLDQQSSCSYDLFRIIIDSDIHCGSAVIWSLKDAEGFLECQIAYLWKIAECLAVGCELLGEESRSETGDGEHVSEKQKR